MLRENLIHKDVGLFNLYEAPCACDNNGSSVKGTDGNLFAISQCDSVTISVTQGLSTGTYSLYSILGGCLIIIILGITSLIYGRFEGTEEIILIYEKLMEFLAIDGAIDAVIAIDELNTVAMGLGRTLQDGDGKLSQALY